MMKAGHCTIPLTGLKEGSHNYRFKIESDFFALFEGSEIAGGELAVEVNLVKRSSHLELLFSLAGSVQLLCDRCLEPFTYSLESQNRIYARFGDHFEEYDDEVIMIPWGEAYLLLDQLIYEFAHLALPIRRNHPEGIEGENGCDPEMLARISGVADNGETEREEGTESNPVWKRLEGLKDDLLN